MNIINTLNETLLKQPFDKEQNQPTLLSEYQQIAYRYAKIENSIAVLSDMKSDKSYLYYGRVAIQLGLPEKETTEEISSIWEEEIFSKIHPDDLLEKHLLELQFYHLLKNSPASERSNYQVISRIRMLNNSGEYIAMQHRMFYVYSSLQGVLRLALCLYNHIYDNAAFASFYGMIVNSETGDVISADMKKCNNILSARELDVLYWIEQGKRSKEIANLLSISINTVNRHRQNILEKLRVKSSIEACKMAKRLSLI